ncbi:MAG: hypothetical protein JWO56_706 [Acidobacteria bacterium]|nr:hypothetical protein [Acidobacteriota bacterium]
MNATLRHPYMGDLDAPAPGPAPLWVEAPRFRPRHAGRSIDELYADIRIACRHCGLKVLDGHHAGWDAHKFEPYPINPNPDKENQA